MLDLELKLLFRARKSMSDVVGVAELHFFRAKLLGIRTRSEILNSHVNLVCQ